MNLIQELQRGFALQNAGRNAEAASVYIAILQEQPHNADANHLLGLVFLGQGNVAKAVESIEKAITTVPDSSVFWGNLGVALRRAERIDEAIAAYQRSLQLDLSSADTQFNLGKSLRLVGKDREAEDCFIKAIALNSSKSGPYLSLMNLFVEQRRLAEALEIGSTAVSRCPKSSELFMSLGAVSKRLQQFEQAIEHYRTAVALSPTNLDAICRIASTLISRHQIEEGKQWLNRAMQLDPNNIHALNSLGLLHNTLGDTTNAVRVFRQAITTHTTYATAFANYGSALKKQGALSEALDSVRRARELDSTSYESILLEGGIQLSLGELDAADQLFRNAMERRGEYRDAHDSLLMCQHYRPETTPESLLREHCDWNAKYAIGVKGPLSIRRPIAASRPLRLGFVSADLGAHPVGYFAANVFQYLDRERFHTFVYSDRLGRDWLASKIEKNVHHWIDSGSLSDERLAEEILGDEIDILFDLAGHTAYNRLLVFAKRVAPLQISWAGYVGTTGLSEMDGLIADYFHVPVGMEKDYVEEVLRMPNGYVCYLAPEDCPDVSELPAIRNGFVTFGAMCNPAKVNPQLLRAWGAVLSKIPSSRLLLSYCGWNDPANQLRVRNALKVFDAEDRVDFSFLPSSKELLGLYGKVDIALDTFPYSGGLTTIEALWMGVPTITWPGQWFAGRHSLSHLSNVGLSDWVASSPEEYVSKAVQFASDLARLALLRSQLREQVRVSPLCDGELFATNFASLLENTWRQRAM